MPLGGGGGGPTLNGKCHFKFPFWLLEPFPQTNYQMLRKLECNGGLIFKVVLMCCRAGKTLSKGPAATFRPKGVCFLTYTGLLTFYGPQYLSSFSSWRRKSKKFPCFTKFRVPLVNLFVSLLQTQFWCHRPSTQLVWTVIIPQSFHGYPRNWPGVDSSSSTSSQSEMLPIFVT